MSYSCRKQVYLHRKMMQKRYNSHFAEAKASLDWESSAKTSDMNARMSLHINDYRKPHIFVVSVFCSYFL